MSANNQTLISEHNGKYYVFKNTMAESWDDENILSVKEASNVFDTELEALLFASKLEASEGTEYGISLDYLAKDNCGVTLIDI